MVQVQIQDILSMEWLSAPVATLVAGDPTRTCCGCVIDSRQVEPGSIFVAFPGERVDGNDFARSAIEAGAACVALTRAPEPELIACAESHGCAILSIESGEAFLLALARFWRERLDCTVVGVTGSIGKTTTKDMLAQILSTTYRVHATAGNFNNLIGMPLTILSAPEDTQVLVLEMGMNTRGEIEQLSRAARPNIAAITKIGTSHIGMLGSRENIALAKMEITCGMQPIPEGAEVGEPHAAPVLALPADDDFFPFLLEHIADYTPGIEPVRCGAHAGCDYKRGDIALDDEGHPHVSVELPGCRSLEVVLSTVGAQTVSNAVLAIAVADRLGVAGEDIVRALGDLTVTGRRQEIRRAATGARVIDDSYNASPESMAAALDLLCLLPATGSRIAVLGEIGELGDEAPRLHELVGAYAAAKKLDYLVCVGGEDAQHMARAALLMGLSDDAVLVLEDTDEAIARLAGIFAQDNVVLVKGSRFVGLDRLVEEVC